MFFPAHAVHPYFIALYLFTQDDDGDITNGTPHMQAIFAAHNRQEIACDTPTVQDSGCSGTPRVAPEVTVISGSMQNIITWTSVSNATNYQVFRTEGVYKCAQGKVLLATLPSDTLNFTDTGLMNGREYFYIVIPKGHDDACFGLASECIQASPSQGPGYQLTCRPELVVLNKAEERINATHLCTLFAMSDYTGAISLTCAGMTGVECTPPSSITFLPGDEYIHAQISINATASASIGGGQLYVSATDGTTQRKAHISVLVVTPGGTQTGNFQWFSHLLPFNTFVSSSLSTSTYFYLRNYNPKRHTILLLVYRLALHQAPNAHREICSTEEEILKSIRQTYWMIVTMGAGGPIIFIHLMTKSSLGQANEMELALSSQLLKDRMLQSVRRFGHLLPRAASLTFTTLLTSLPTQRGNILELLQRPRLERQRS